MRRFKRFSGTSLFSEASRFSGFLSVLIFASTLSAGFFSCKVLSDSFNEPVKEYFKEYTETAAVMRYEITGGEWNLDAEGRISLSSAKDTEITLYLRNPQGFRFSESDASLSFSALDNSLVKNTFGLEADTNLVTVRQSQDDFLVMKLLFPSSFLSSTETGFEVSPDITLFHPETRVVFPTYSDLKVYSNSAPPSVYGSVLYKDSESGKYVLLFNMPEKNLVSGIHRDINYISVYSSRSGLSESEIVVDSSGGTFTFSSYKFAVGNATDKYTPPESGLKFEEKGQASYFFTDDIFSESDTEYTVILKDSSGLYSEVRASVNSTKLSPLTLTDNNGNTIAMNQSDEEIVEQDEGSSYASVTFTPALIATDFQGTEHDTQDSVVVYEIYQGENENGKLLMSGRNGGGSLSVLLPAGKIFIKVYAHKDLFADSDVQEYRLNILRNTLYVSPEGNDDTNNGSENSPFATVSKTLSESGFSDLATLGTVWLEGSISDSPELSLQSANLVVHGNGNSITDFKMSSPGGKFTAESLSLTGKLDVQQGKVLFRNGNAGGLSLNGGEIEFSDGKIGGDVNVSGGSLEVKGGTLEGKTAVSLGKLEASETSLNGIEVSGGEVSLTGGSAGGNVTVTGGNVSVSGTTLNGNINVSNGNVTLENLTLNGNINVTGGTLTIENVALTGNITVSGSGKLSAGDTTMIGNLSISDGTSSVISVNGIAGSKMNATDKNVNLVGGNTGKIDVSGGTLSIENATLNGNVTESSGGTVSVSESTVNGTLTLKCGITVNAISGSKVNVSDKNVALNGGEVGGDVAVPDGTFAVVSEGSTVVSGDINISGGNVTLENTKAGKNITYTGGKLLLSGNTSVSGKITMSPNLTISVKNLQASGGAKAASIASSDGFDSWQKETAVLESAEGNTSSMSEICRLFAIDSSKWILVQGTVSDQDKGVLGASGASVEIENYEVKFSLDKTTATKNAETKITVTAKLSEGGTEKDVTSNITDWNLSLRLSGTEAQAVSTNSITIQSSYPGGNYTLYVSGKYNGVRVSGQFKVEVK